MSATVQRSGSRGKYTKISLEIREKVIENVFNKGMKQADLAKLLGINKHTVSSIVKTFRKTSRIGTIHKGKKP